jgi:DNA-binding FadR family transcriptional regulator
VPKIDPITCIDQPIRPIVPLDTNQNNLISNKAHELLKQFISTAGYEPGDRLPAERELTHSLGISRSSLRKGLDALEREGAIWRHVGKGTFVSAPNADDAFANITRLSQQITPVQMMRARLALEPAIAREAAANASAAAIKRLTDAHNCAVSATCWDDYEASDDDFHLAIAEATGNVLLQSLFEHLNQVRRAVAWRQVIRKTETPPKEHTSFKEHIRILCAIETRDPVEAHDAMRDHLKSVANRLFGDL